VSTAVTRLDASLTESFPVEMEPGILYVSLEYRTCAHLCACGCGEEVVTPLSPALWRVTYDGETVSLAPSIGNWALPCRSHYWIDRGIVSWADRYSRGQASRARNDDRRDIQRLGAPGPWRSLIDQVSGKILCKLLLRASQKETLRVTRRRGQL
jgi:hypothetical protein